jgi:excisionase family DNA binding protein
MKMKPTVDPLDDFLQAAVTASELAKILEVPRGNVYDRIASGRLRAWRLGERQYVIRKTDAVNALNVEAETLRAKADRIDRALERLCQPA